MKSKKKTTKQVKAGKGNQKLTLIIEVIICLVVLSMCFGGGKNSKESTSADREKETIEKTEYSEEPKESESSGEEITEKEEEPKQEEEPIDYAQLFIDQYNANCTTPPITAVESFVPKDHGPYYRVEFRLGAYRDCVGTHCRIGDNDINDGSIDIISWPDHAYYRIYIDGHGETFATAFIDTIKLLQPSAFSDEFLSELKDELINGNKGYYDLSRMIEDENFDMYGKVICGTSEFASAYDDSVSQGIVEGGIRVDE